MPSSALLPYHVNAEVFLVAQTRLASFVAKVIRFSAFCLDALLTLRDTD